ncbi:MAG: YqcI/YcgG family protein, partial [Tardiphaga sp.]
MNTERPIEFPFFRACEGNRFANATRLRTPRYMLMHPILDDIRHPLSEQFINFIGGADFPCVGAKAAANRDGIRFVVARDFGSAWDDLRILPGLLDIAQRYRADPVPFQSLVVLFEDGAPDDEEAFERQLWARLQSLT